MAKAPQYQIDLLETVVKRLKRGPAMSSVYKQKPSEVWLHWLESWVIPHLTALVDAMEGDPEGRRDAKEFSQHG